MSINIPWQAHHRALGECSLFAYQAAYLDCVAWLYTASAGAEGDVEAAGVDASVRYQDCWYHRGCLDLQSREALIRHFWPPRPTLVCPDIASDTTCLKATLSRMECSLLQLSPLALEEHNRSHFWWQCPQCTVPARFRINDVDSISNGSEASVAGSLDHDTILTSANMAAHARLHACSNVIWPSWIDRGQALPRLTITKKGWIRAYAFFLCTGIDWTDPIAWRGCCFGISSDQVPENFGCGYLKTISYDSSVGYYEGFGQWKLRQIPEEELKVLNNLALHDLKQRIWTCMERSSYGKILLMHALDIQMIGIYIRWDDGARAAMKRIGGGIFKIEGIEQFD